MPTLAMTLGRVRQHRKDHDRDRCRVAERSIGRRDSSTTAPLRRCSPIRIAPAVRLSIVWSTTMPSVERPLDLAGIAPSIGCSSTPNDGAAVCTAGELADAGDRRLAQHRCESD
jgi:hypothetical protein